MKKSLTIIGIILATILLAAIAILTAVKLKESGTSPVAPNVPESEPKAVETLPIESTAECTKSFQVTTTEVVTCGSKVAYRNDSRNTAGNYYPAYPSQIIGNEETVEKGEIVLFSVSVPALSVKKQYVFTDILPSSLIYVDGEGGCDYVASTRTVTCSNDTGWPRKFRVKIADNASGTITNTAKVKAEGDPESSCTKTLTVKAPVLSCNDTCSVNDLCPSGLSCVGGYCRNSSCTAETDCTCPALVCNDICTVNIDASNTECPSGTICSSGRCRNSSCSTETDCTCPVPSVTPIPACNDTCSSNDLCPSGLSCIEGFCRNLSCTTETDCDCPAPACNDSCTVSSTCPTDTSCISGFCRKSACSTQTDCTCPVVGESYCDYLYASPTSGTASLTVEFTGKGYDTAKVKGFRFTFGDGEKKEMLGSYSSSTIETVNHTYTKNGIYKAVLEILDDGDHWRTRAECEKTITVSGGTSPVPTVTRVPTRVVAPTEPTLPVAGIKIPTLAGIIAGFLLISLGAALLF